MRKHTFVYKPGLMDACDPAVIRGHAIEPGSPVWIVRKRPHMLPTCFQVIRDAHGNVQTVWRYALVRASSVEVMK